MAGPIDMYIMAAFPHTMADFRIELSSLGGAHLEVQGEISLPRIATRPVTINKTYTVPISPPKGIEVRVLISFDFFEHLKFG